MGPVGVAAELLVECIKCETWGNVAVSTAGVKKDEGLIGDIATFIENPVDAITSAFSLDVRVDLGNVKGHIELDVKAAAAASVSIPILVSDISAGIPCSEDVSVGLMLAVDLVLSVDAAIDVQAGFEYSLPEGCYITVNPLTGDIVDKNM